MRYKTPIEARKALNIRVRTKLAEIPGDMRSPIPVAEWLDNPKSFCKQRFIRETVSMALSNKPFNIRPFFSPMKWRPISVQPLALLKAGLRLSLTANKVHG